MAKQATGTDISKATGFFDIWFEFTSKWREQIQPVDLARFLHGQNVMNIFLDNTHHGNVKMLISELKEKLLSNEKSLNEFSEFVHQF